MTRYSVTQKSVCWIAIHFLTPNSCGNFSDRSASRINLYVICRRCASWTKLALSWKIDIFRAPRPAYRWIPRHLRWMEPFLVSKPDLINHCNAVIRKARNCVPQPTQTLSVGCVHLLYKTKGSFNVLPSPTGLNV
jgi:hypothetical protein